MQAEEAQEGDDDVDAQGCQQGEQDGVVGEQPGRRLVVLVFLFFWLAWGRICIFDRCARLLAALLAAAAGLTAQLHEEVWLLIEEEVVHVSSMKLRLL